MRHHRHYFIRSTTASLFLLGCIAVSAQDWPSRTATVMKPELAHWKPVIERYCISAD